jgi:dUTP pyrophosphatase|tara:strand:- start:209 stop:643 length:435 start_codon:yes stop_codon:yes gene_type:complete
MELGYKYFETKLLYDSAKPPTKGHMNDAGWDLYAFETISIPAGATVLVSTGVAIAIPKEHVALIWDRSSMGVKGVHRHAGVIDSGYRGEVKVCLHNTTKEPYHIDRGDRIAQMLIQKAPNFIQHVVQELDSTNRGDGGFGSTGK